MKKNLIKKYIAIALIAILCVGIMPIRSWAEENEDDNYYYVYSKEDPQIPGAISIGEVSRFTKFQRIGKNVGEEEIEKYKREGWVEFDRENWTVDIEKDTGGVKNIINNLNYDEYKQNYKSTDTISYKIVSSKIIMSKHNVEEPELVKLGWMTDQERANTIEKYIKSNNYYDAAYYSETTTKWKVPKTNPKEQPKVTENVEIPETADFELSEEAYKEYINHLFETKNAKATEGDIAAFLDKTKGETTTTILKTFEDLSAQDFIELLKKDVVHISESNVTIEKAKTLLENGQINKQQAILYILSNSDIQNKINDYYQGIVDARLKDEEISKLNEEEEQNERIDNRGSTIQKGILEEYFKEMYRLLANKPDAESVVRLDEDDLKDLIELYNKGYDVEDCVVELLNSKGVVNNEVLKEKDNKEFVERVYSAIIFAMPNDYNLGKLTKKLENGKSREDVVTSILKTAEFKQFKQSLIDGTFTGEVAMQQEETFDICTTGKRGDIDGDGRITCADAQLLLNIVTDAALHEEKYINYIGVLDINNNEEVDVDDALVILEYYVKVDLTGKEDIDSIEKYLENRKTDD